MSYWIESHQSLSRHRKTLRAVALLKVDRHKLLGHLHELWWWALDNADEEGALPRSTARMIGIAAGWPIRRAERFVEVMVEVGFIDVPDGVYVIHDWYQFAGKLYSQRDLRRAANRDAQRRRRQRLSAVTSDDTSANVTADENDTSSTVSTLPDRTGPDQPDRTNQPDQPAGSPRLARLARARKELRPLGAVLSAADLARHEELLAKERASRAGPAEPSKNSENGAHDDHD